MPASIFLYQFNERLSPRRTFLLQAQPLMGTLVFVDLETHEKEKFFHMKLVGLS